MIFVTLPLANNRNITLIMSAITAIVDGYDGENSAYVYTNNEEPFIVSMGREDIIALLKGLAV